MHESESKAHESNIEVLDCDKSKVAKAEDEPVSQEGDNESEGFEARKEGRVKKIKRTLEKGVSQLTSGFAELGKGISDSFTKKSKAAFSYVMGKNTSQLVYYKRRSIDLPRGRGPKNYSCLITYKPINRELNPEPLITVTIKPSGRCHHEDTHLFVRFAS